MALDVLEHAMKVFFQEGKKVRRGNTKQRLQTAKGVLMAWRKMNSDYVQKFWTCRFQSPIFFFF